MSAKGGSSQRKVPQWRCCLATTYHQLRLKSKVKLVQRERINNLRLSVTVEETIFDSTESLYCLLVWSKPQTLSSYRRYSPGFLSNSRLRSSYFLLCYVLSYGFVFVYVAQFPPGRQNGDVSEQMNQTCFS